MVGSVIGGTADAAYESGKGLDDLCNNLQIAEGKIFKDETTLARDFTR